MNEEIQKTKVNRGYVKRYLKMKPYFIVIIKYDNVNEVPSNYLKDFVKWYKVPGKKSPKDLLPEKAKSLLPAQENALVIYNGKDLIASIKY